MITMTCLSRYSWRTNSKPSRCAWERGQNVWGDVYVFAMGGWDNYTAGTSNVCFFFHDGFQPSVEATSKDQVALYYPQAFQISTPII